MGLLLKPTKKTHTQITHTPQQVIWCRWKVCQSLICLAFAENATEMLWHHPLNKTAQWPTKPKENVNEEGYRKSLKGMQRKRDRSRVIKMWERKKLNVIKFLYSILSMYRCCVSHAIVHGRQIACNNGKFCTSHEYSVLIVRVECGKTTIRITATLAPVQAFNMYLNEDSEINFSHMYLQFR